MFFNSPTRGDHKYSMPTALTVITTCCLHGCKAWPSSRLKKLVYRSSAECVRASSSRLRAQERELCSKAWSHGVPDMPGLQPACTSYSAALAMLESSLVPAWPCLQLGVGSCVANERHCQAAEGALPAAGWRRHPPLLNPVSCSFWCKTCPKQTLAG